MEILWYNRGMETNEKIHSFGRNLREFRKNKGYTQTKLAELSGVSQRAIVHYENHAKRPTLEKVKKLSSALGVSDDELLGVKTLKIRKNEEDVSYKIMKKVRIIEKFPTRDQNAVFHFINSLAEKNKLKGKI
jgi:transcriptional regulator with XRE-family HTH domain